MDSRRRLAPKDSLAILSLHGKLTFLIAKYCKAQFSHNPLVEAADNDPLPPSQSELHRLYRAFWRYEIYSNFFGPSNEPSGRNSSVAGIDRVIENEPSQIPDYTFRADEIVDGFFGLFPTHEVEELACLAEITRNYYLCFESSSCWERRNQLVTLGPKQLYQVLTAAAENECEARIAEVMKAERVAVTMRDALDEYDTDVSWWGWHWRDKCKIFVSERGSTVGWLWASSRGVQNTDHSLRRWGYVFWGQERLDAWGITQEHMGNWPHCRRTPGDLARQMWS